MGPADAAPLGRPPALVIGEVPAGDAAAELGGRVGHEDGDAEPGGERVGVVGRQGSGSRHDGSDARQVGRVDVGLEDHSQGGGHQARGHGTVAPDGIDPSVYGEPLQQGERSAIVHALEDPEQPSEMHEGGVDDGHAGAQARPGVAVGLVVLRPFEHALECLVGQIDPLGCTGRPAGEHADGDTGPVGVATGAARPGGDGRPQVIDLDEGGPRLRWSYQQTEVLWAAGQVREIEAGDVVAGALYPPPGVDGDEAPTGAQHAEQRPKLRRAVAQQHPYRGAGPRDDACDGFDRGAELAPGSPSTAVLDGRSGGIDGGDGGDALAQCGGAGIHQPPSSPMRVPRASAWASPVPKACSRTHARLRR